MNVELVRANVAILMSLGGTASAACALLALAAARLAPTAPDVVPAAPGPAVHAPPGARSADARLTQGAQTCPHPCAASDSRR
jgi:hypothetical protein